jgi:hypothetical protein
MNVTQASGQCALNITKLWPPPQPNSIPSQQFFHENIFNLIQVRNGLCFSPQPLPKKGFFLTKKKKKKKNN